MKSDVNCGTTLKPVSRPSTETLVTCLSNLTIILYYDVLTLDTMIILVCCFEVYILLDTCDHTDSQYRLPNKWQEASLIFCTACMELTPSRTRSKCLYSLIPLNMGQRRIQENAPQNTIWIFICNCRLIECSYFLSFRFVVSDIVT